MSMEFGYNENQLSASANPRMSYRDGDDCEGWSNWMPHEDEPEDEEEPFDGYNGYALEHKEADDRERLLEFNSLSGRDGFSFYKSCPVTPGASFGCWTGARP